LQSDLLLLVFLIEVLDALDDLVVGAHLLELYVVGCEVAVTVALVATASKATC